MTRTRNTEEKITDSWKAHQEFLEAVERFLGEIRIRDGDVWIREVCLGSPNRPCVRAPLISHSAALVAESVSLALKVAADVTDTLQRALQITHDRVEQLMTEGDVDPDDLARVRDRNQALEGLRDELAGAAKLSPLMFHPAILSSWHGILRGRFVPGDPSVRVRVVTTHLL